MIDRRRRAFVGVPLRAFAAGFLGFLALGAHGSGGDGAAVAPRGGEALLEAAFANRYDVDFTSRIELVIRDRSGSQRRRVFETASKVIDGRMHSIGRLLYPHHLRGMTILQIESPERRQDAFIYLPSLKTVRRVTTAQRGDSFFGTDVTYEDLERRYGDDYEVDETKEGMWQDEAVWRIRARPRDARRYHAVLFTLARADRAILEARYYKRGSDEPYRVVTALRSEMQSGAGHVLPTRITVENLAQGTTTEVRYDALEIDPEIDDRVFSKRSLDQRRPIPGSARNDAPARRED